MADDARGTTDAGEHEWIGLELAEPHGHVAVCSCGWLSAPLSSAGRRWCRRRALCSSHRTDAPDGVTSTLRWLPVSGARWSGPW